MAIGTLRGTRSGTKDRETLSRTGGKQVQCCRPIGPTVVSQVPQSAVSGESDRKFLNASFASFRCGRGHVPTTMFYRYADFHFLPAALQNKKISRLLSYKNTIGPTT